MASSTNIPTTETHIPASFELGAIVTKISGVESGMPCVVEELYTNGTINCVGINGARFRKQDANNFVLFNDPRAAAATKKALAPKEDKAAADIKALTKKNDDLTDTVVQLRLELRYAAEQLTTEQELRKEEQEKRKALTEQNREMHAHIQKGNSFVAPPPFTPEKGN